MIYHRTMNVARIKTGILRTGIICVLVVLPVFFTCCVSAKRIENPETDFEWRIKDGDAIIVKYIGESLDVVIPRKVQGCPVTEIEKGAFHRTQSENNGQRYHLSSVDIPDTVKFIADRTFSGIPLSSVIIPRSVSSIGESAFEACGLTSVVFSRGVIRIGKSAFARNKLTSVVFPRDIREINNFAFQHNELVSVTFPNTTLSWIGKYAFANNKIRSVTIPSISWYIDSLAFWDNELHTISLPKELSRIGEGAFADNNLSSVTIPENIYRIGRLAFTDNPIKEVVVKSKRLYPMPAYVFHPQLPGFLPPGKYVLGDDENWFAQTSGGTLLSMQSFYEALSENNPDVLTSLLFDAVTRQDAAMLRNWISRGADVKSKMAAEDDKIGEGGIYDFSRETTPLAWALEPATLDYYHHSSKGPDPEVIRILLEAGAVAQHWMLGFSYLEPGVTKALLEYGALTNRELPVHGEPPQYYKRPASLLIHYISYISQLQGRSSDTNSRIVESAALLLEYGEDVHYRDPKTGNTPLSLALGMQNHSPEITNLLLRHVNRPLSLEEYRLLIRLNREKVYRYVWEEEDVDKEHEDKWGYDALVLEDIRNGILDPTSKDKDGRDIFDYAAATGTAGLMQGLLPYLARSGRTIFAPNRTGLYVDALGANNFAVATVLFAATNTVFAMTDAQGRSYSLEFYNYDREAIYRRAQELLRYSLYQTGPGGTRHISGSGEDILFWPNTFYVFDRYDLSLHTVGGLRLNLKEIINAGLEQYYLEKGGEQSDKNNPNWHIARMFGNVLFASTSYWNEGEYALINIATGTPSVYILKKESLETTSNIGRYLLENAMDFVIESGIGYLIKSTGEVFQFTVGGRSGGAGAYEAHSFTFDTTVSWRDCRIPGWKNGERVFVDGETVVAYNFATGAVRPLGKKAETAVGNENYVFEDRDGRRFIVEAKSARAYPEPMEEFETFAFHENGYVYADKGSYFSTVCFFEGGALKRKIVLSGSAISYQTINVHGNKIYIGRNSIAFTIDIRTTQVSTAFRTGSSLSSYDIMYIFPFGPDDVVYTYTFSDH